MKRITCDEVVAAYEKIGLNPISHADVWRDDDDTIVQCCPAVAVGLAQGIVYDENHSSEFWVAAGYRYGKDYIDGFVHGVDDVGYNRPENGDYCRGYDDGVSVRRELSL
jgi:hypothetical protein